MVDNSFENLLKKSWHENSKLEDNLMSFKEDVNQWKMHNLKSIIKEKKELIQRIKGIQGIVQNGRDPAGLRKLEKHLQIKLAKVQYMVNGDRNTNFYHTKVVQHRRRKVVNVIKDGEGNWIDASGKIRELFNTNFLNLYTKDLAATAWSKMHHAFSNMDKHHRRSLEADINNYEVQKMLFDMATWKCPGPDSFHAGFY
ncbi:uncharacterized protein LOC127123748 [Lathyrus oleraceus]|uniref:uncharacterized protein LOC127123748 n=1 Tax=Pisum sativum TaxID=3888 RepID=UPI001FC6326C|nr:uncharacterized protein LOC127123748 [Pisum sativum]